MDRHLALVRHADCVPQKYTGMLIALRYSRHIVGTEVSPKVNCVNSSDIGAVVLDLALGSGVETQLCRLLII